MGSLVQDSSATHDLGRGAFSLTDAECGVLQLVALGLTAQEIAEDSERSPRTVQFHTANIRDKSGFDSMHAVVVGLLRTDPDFLRAFVEDMEAMLPPFPGSVRDPSKLTDTKLWIATMLFSPLSIADLAQGCGVSKRTLDFHIAELYDRFGVSDRLECIGRMLSMGLFASVPTPQEIEAAQEAYRRRSMTRL